LANRILVVGALGFFGLVLLVVLAAGPASAVPEPRLPSVAWVTGMDHGRTSRGMPSSEPTKPLVGPVHESPAKAAKAPSPQPASPPPAKAAPSPARVEPPKAAPAKSEPAAAKAELPKVEPPAPAAPPPSPARSTPTKPEAKAASPTPAPGKTPPASEGAESAEEQGVGVLVVGSNPAGAAVFLDGANVGQTPIELEVPTGNHSLRVSSPYDGTDRTRAARVKAGETSRVDFTF